MQFPWSFTRRDPQPASCRAALPPRRVLSETEAAATLRADNVLTSRQVNSQGWPVQRVAFAWIGPPDSDASLFDVRGYVFDHRIGVWLLMTEVARVEPWRVYLLDVPTLLDAPTVGRKGGAIVGPQALEVMVCPLFSDGDETPAPPGEYTFVMGADVSSTP
jgi:hypothetical protein